MPRQRKPQWVSPGKDRNGDPRPGRWRTKIDGKWYYAPKEIGRKDVGHAYAWLGDLEKRELHRSTAGTDPTVYWLALAYLKWAEGERDAGRLTPEQWKGQRSRLALLLAWPEVKETKARLLTVDTLAEFFAAVRDGRLTGKGGRRYSTSYLAGVGRTVRTVFRWGARPVPGRVPTRYLPANPLDGMKFPRAPGAVRGYVEGATVRRFLRWAWARARKGKGNARRFDRVFLLMLWFQRLTGCRPGEACRLRWDHWDRAAGTITLTEHKAKAKTGKDRTIYVTTPVLRLLAALDRLPGRHAEFVFTHRRGVGAIARGHLESLAGEPWPSGSAASGKVRRLRDAAIAAKVTGVEGVGPKRLVAYVNRHGYASEAVSKGLSIEHTAELLGNTAAVTASVYTHSIKVAAAARAEGLTRKGKKP